MPNPRRGQFGLSAQNRRRDRPGHPPARRRPSGYQTTGWRPERQTITDQPVPAARPGSAVRVRPPCFPAAAAPDRSFRRSANTRWHSGRLGRPGSRRQRTPADSRHLTRAKPPTRPPASVTGSAEPGARHGRRPPPDAGLGSLSRDRRPQRGGRRHSPAHVSPSDPPTARPVVARSASSGGTPRQVTSTSRVRRCSSKKRPADPGGYHPTEPW